MKSYKPTPAQEPDQLRRYQREARDGSRGRACRAYRGQVRRVLTRLRRAALRHGTLGRVHFSCEEVTGRFGERFVLMWSAQAGNPQGYTIVRAKVPSVGSARRRDGNDADDLVDDDTWQECPPDDDDEIVL